MNKLASKSIYWMFVLRLVDREFIAAWADSLIENGNLDEFLFDISTCSQMDDNEIMHYLKSINDRPDKSKITIDLLISLRDYFDKDGDELVNLSLLSDLECIDDLDKDTRHKIAWLADEICLQREGVIYKFNERQTIVNEINSIINAQQVDAPEPITP
jgi:hypothetical protein